MLGAAGATVYCTGRTTRASLRARRSTRGKSAPFDLTKRRETIDDTASIVTELGGKGIAVKCDHTDEASVKRLFAKVKKEHGRLDVLVNDVWGGDALMQWGKPFWEQDAKKGFAMFDTVVHAHVLTSRWGVPLLLESARRDRAKKRAPLVVEITDGDRLNYRMDFFYDLVKTTCIRLAFAMSEELRAHGVASVAVTPGFLRSEAMLEHFGVTEETWRAGAKMDANFVASETPWYVGRAIAALAADENVMAKTGRAYSSWRLAKEYGFTDRDGSQPDFDAHLAQVKDPATIAIRDEQNASHARFIGSFAR